MNRNKNVRWIAVAGIALWCANIVACWADEPVERVKTIQVPGAQKIFKAQLGADGTIHLLFETDAGPQYVRSVDGGQTFSQPIAVVDSSAHRPGLEFHAWDLAVSKDGRVHVALGNNAWKLKLPQEEWGYFYATLAPGESKFSPLRNLNRTPSEGFSLAVNDNGSVVACFLSGRLLAMVSRDDGKSFGNWVELNPAWNPCDCCTTSVACGPDGRMAVLYREETGNERDIYVVLWDQSPNSQPSRARVSSTPWKIEGCPMTYFAISPTPGGYVAAWPTKGQVYFARLNQDGEVQPPGEIRTPGMSGMRQGLLVLNAADGGTLIGWKNQDTLGWQLYDGKGKPRGSPGSISSAGAGAAGVALDGRFILFP